MADRQTALAVINKLKESGISDEDIRGRLQPLSQEQRNSEFDKLAQRFGITSEKVAPVDRGMQFVPDTPERTQEELEQQARVTRGRKIVSERGAGATAAFVRGAETTTLVGQAEEAIGAARALGSDVSAIGGIEEEEAVSAALKQDHPIAFTIGEIAPFLTPLGVPKALSKAGTKAATVAAPVIAGATNIAKKIFPSISNPKVLEAMGTAFVKGATELGLFEGAKELLETGDAKKAAKAAGRSALAGGVASAAFGGAAEKLSQSFNIKASDAENAIAIGLKQKAKEEAVQAAAKEGDKAKRLTEKILIENDPNVIGPILNNPETVKKIVERGGIDNADIGKKLLENFKDIKSQLVIAVAKIKRPVQKDTSTLVDVGLAKKAILATEKSLSNTKGSSVLNEEAKREFASAKEFLYEDKINVSDALLAVEKIQSFVNYTKREGTNISEAASRGLKTARRAIKSRLHRMYPKWSQADEYLSKFKELSEDLEGQITKNPEAFVSNIFGRNKTQVRKSLVELAALARKVDPSIKGEVKDIYQSLVASRSAKAIMEAKFPTKRTVQEGAFRTSEKARNIGAAVGGTIGSYIGGIVAGGQGAVAGLAAGGGAGGAIGQKIGNSLVNPMNIVNAALRSKQLSAKAKMIAKDLQKATLEGGAEGFGKMLDLIPVTSKAGVDIAEFILNNSNLTTADILEPEQIEGMRRKNSVDSLVNKSLEEVDQ